MFDISQILVDPHNNMYLLILYIKTLSSVQVSDLTT